MLYFEVDSKSVAYIYSAKVRTQIQSSLIVKVLYFRKKNLQTTRSSTSSISRTGQGSTNDRTLFWASLGELVKNVFVICCFVCQARAMTDN